MDTHDHRAIVLEALQGDENAKQTARKCRDGCDKAMMHFMQKLTIMHRDNARQLSYRIESLTGSPEARD